MCRCFRCLPAQRYRHPNLHPRRTHRPDCPVQGGGPNPRLPRSSVVLLRRSGAAASQLEQKEKKKSRGRARHSAAQRRMDWTGEQTDGRLAGGTASPVGRRTSDYTLTHATHRPRHLGFSLSVSAGGKRRSGAHRHHHRAPQHKRNSGTHLVKLQPGPPHGRRRR